MTETGYMVQTVGFIHSGLITRKDAPHQGTEGAPDAWIEVDPVFAQGLEGIAVDSEIIVITWLHKTNRNIFKLHPRGDKSMPLTGVFNTRSPDRPNPIGLHRVKVLEISGNRLKVGPIEAIDKTPVIDIKPVLQKPSDS